VIRIRHTLLAAASAATIAACASPTADNPTARASNGPQDQKVVVTASTATPGKPKTSVADAQQAVEAYAPPQPPPMPLAAPRMKMEAGRMVGGYVSPQYQPQPLPGDVDRDKYDHTKINPVKLVSEEPVSTFSIDVDTASYSNVRRFLNSGTLPPKDAVRIEELVNYFDYDYALPADKTTPFATHVTVTPSPWGKGRELMHIGIQGYDLNRDSRPPLNLTLLLDTSGSMSPEDRLPLAVKALKLLVDQLGPRDHVAIVAYAGSAGEVLAPTSGADKQKILAALDHLSAGGSTAGGEGLRLAYSLAKQNVDKKGVNRVVLMTDGDFNVGINDPERLKDFVEREREGGVYLSVFGFGRSNYNDALMQKLAQNGNGQAAYIDTLNEARKVFNDDFSGSMFTIANDVKIQVEFNPAKAAEYRLIGYETRILNREDFNNDKVDAGDIGAGTSVTAIYEITPVGSSAKLVDDKRYQAAPKLVSDKTSSEFAFLKLRYKMPGETTSKLIDRPITDRDLINDVAKAPESTRFAEAVAAYGEMLRGDPYMDKGYGWDQVISLASGAKGKDEFGYRAEFIQLARLAKTAASQSPLPRPNGSGD
jgi:Ca-activated chloride channel family protein